MTNKRKNYTAYKDGLAVIDLPAGSLKKLAENKACIVAFYRNAAGHKVRVRIQPKPAKRLTAAQENAKLKRELAKLRKALGQTGCELQAA